MKKICGLVLDIYDDVDGEVYKQLVHSNGQAQEMVKRAHCISPEERDRLPDDVFALVLINNGDVLRKYACVDEGNTALAVEYFLKTAHKLPVEAQKVAAKNLETACGWYGIDPPEELRKMAIGLMTAIEAATTLPGAVKETAANLKHNKGPVVIPPKQRIANLQRAGFPG